MKAGRVKKEWWDGAFFLKTTRLYSAVTVFPTSFCQGMHRGMRTERADTVQRDPIGETSDT
jgi:hypothetical protein